MFALMPLSDPDVSRRVEAVFTNRDLHWVGEYGPVGRKSSFSLLSTAQLIAKVRSCIKGAASSEPYEIVLVTQGNSVILTLLLGAENEEWRRSVVRAECTVPSELKFCQFPSRYVLERRP